MGGGCWGCGFALLLKDPPLCSPLNPQIPVDNLSWEFIVSTVDDSNLVYPPKVGAEVWGGEGAGSKPRENNWLRREKRDDTLGVLAAKGLHFSPNLPPTLQRVFPGWSLGPWPVPGGRWLGQEELLLGRGGAHAACLPHAHDPLQAYRKSQEERQGWAAFQSLVWILTHPGPRPSPTPAGALLSPRRPGALTYDSSSSPFPQVCTPVPAITIPTERAAQTDPPLSSASTSDRGP